VLAALLTAFAEAQTPGLRNAQLTILQLNDVYETGPVDGRGGLARVATLERQIVKEGNTPLLVLAGDFLSSSVASTVFKGRQMIDAFNAMGLDFATLGNHEFDFGKDVLLERMAESKFEYLVANVLDEATGRPVGGAAAYTTRTYNGLKVGFFGVCLTSEEISVESRRGLRFLDPIAAATDAVAALRREGAQAIVAITHLSFADDRRLARALPDISVIAGGHEHFPITAVVDRTLIIKAGANAEQVARIDLRLEAEGLTRHVAMLPIDAALPDDPATAAVVAGYEAKLGAELEVVIGRSRVPLDADTVRLRTGETNLGNFIADAIRADAGADIAIINAGSIRGDRLYPAGALTRRTLLAMQPFGNVVTAARITGRTVLRALNAGTAQWPAAAGRFPQVSGLTFTLETVRPEGERVVNVRVGEAPLSLDRAYTVAIPNYLLEGGDGYDMFGGAPLVRSPESGNLIVTALENFIAARGEIAPAVEGRITIVP
jgi:5'-nucleotidase / UDP-sugar diphosphatase